MGSPASVPLTTSARCLRVRERSCPTGTVALVDDDGDLRLALSDLATSNGPDLRVVLSPKEGVSGDWYGYADGVTYLGALRGNRGTQVYDVPDGLDIAAVASAVIWCERFAVGFDVANLS